MANLDDLIDLLNKEIRRSGSGFCIRPLRRYQAEEILAHLERLRALGAGVRMMTEAFAVEPEGKQEDDK